MRSVFLTGDADADLDGDGVVNFVDLGMLKAAFMGAPGPSAVPNVCDGAVTTRLDFEADQMPPVVDGSFTIGDDPLTATFTGGEVTVPDNPDLARSPKQAWLIGEGESASITFQTPATRFEFFFRHEFGPTLDRASAKSTRQVHCGVFDLGMNNGEAFGEQVFARGAFNDWAGASSDPPSNFINNGDGTYTAEFEMVAGSYGFKIASEDWTIEYSNEGTESLVPDNPIAFPRSDAGSANATVEIPADACYTWTIGEIDDSVIPAPSFTLAIAEKVEAFGPGSEVKVYNTLDDEIVTIPGSTFYELVSVAVDTGEPLISRIEIVNLSFAPDPACGVDDQGGDNTEFFGAEMGVRGSLNDWGFGPPTNLVNFGSGNFQAEFNLAAGIYEFKIASEDWSIEYSTDSPVAIDATSTIDLSAPFSDNATIEIPEDGCYNWSVTVVDDSALPAPTIELLVTLATAEDGSTGVGFAAVDDFAFTAVPQTPRTVALVYHNPSGDYSNTVFHVSGDVVGGDISLVCTPTSDVIVADKTGCFVIVTILPGGTITYFVTNDGIPDDAGAISVEFNSIVTDAVFNFAGSNVPVLTGLPAGPQKNEVILFYKRNDDDYEGWGLHLFPITSPDWTLFPTPGEYPFEGIDPVLGAYFIIALPGSDRLTAPYSANPDPMAEFPPLLGFIIHNGDEKDPGPDQFVRIAEDGNIVFVRSGVNIVSTTPPVDGGVVLDGAAAHWVTADTLVWSHGPGVESVQIAYSADGSIVEAGGRLINVDQLFDLTAGTRPDLPNSRHLEGLTAYAVPGEAFDLAGELVRGQVVAVALDDQGNQVEATAIQFPLLLDVLYADAAADADLGVTYSGSAPTLSVWAPTSVNVSVKLFDSADAASPATTAPLTFDEATGIWSVAGSANWDRKYYTYSLRNYVLSQGGFVDQEVTDPYSVSLSSNGARSQIVNLDDADLKPLDWDSLTKPPLEAPEDITIYELHVRDFSARDPTVLPADQGRFNAFASGGAGVDHLAGLAKAGLTHVHILPPFDFATVNEDASQRVEVTSPIEDLCAVNSAAQSFCDVFGGMTIIDILESFGGADSQQQELVELLRNFDGFNWGYDPVHFNAPDGSYASNADGVARIGEFRTMVKGLSDAGLRVVIDQVYNHTNSSGQNPNSVLDKIVPGYYYRLDANTGDVLRESCCDDTAAEHAMMSKLLVDSVVQWVKDYKVDGIRFDLMSFHPKSTIEQVRDTVQALTIEDDGVDGASIYLYGEGWNFGGIGNDARFVQARQDNLAGTGIGSFNDRVRDAVRGGGPFDLGSSHVDNQGFISGQYYAPNANNSGSGDERNALLGAADRIRIALAGGLADYPLIDSSDEAAVGSSLGGYTADPQEIINYVSSHDNETLWDISQYKHAQDTATADRVRAHNLGNAIVLLGQGVPFLHAGQDLLRSKSMDRNSFDSGDWFNYLDFSAMDNNFAVGLPRADTNQDSLAQIVAVLGLSAAEPGAGDIMLARDVTKEWLRIRNSSRLFRLPTSTGIISRVDFHNTGSTQVPGLIVMSIDGCVTAGYTPEYGSVVAIFNARTDEQVFDLYGDRTFDLHPVQMTSSDAVVTGASHDAAGFTVPARTAAVFVEDQGGAACAAGPGAGFDTARAYLAGEFNSDRFNTAFARVGDADILEATADIVSTGMDQAYRIQSPDQAAINCGAPVGSNLLTPVDGTTKIECSSAPESMLPVVTL